MSQKVLIIYTGGTIGMRNTAKGFCPAEGFDTLIEQHLSSSAQQTLAPYDILEFDCLIDSSNSQPQDWLTIANCISEHYQDYCGFVVLHGTDTMAYTAAALHHILTGIDKNVIVTGSQIPLSQVRSDGAANLLDAVLLARGKTLNQVCLYFANNLFKGHQASKVHSSDFAAFASPNHSSIAHCAIDIHYRGDTSSTVLRKDFKQSLQPVGSVAVLLLYPGISDTAVSAILDDPQAKAVVLLSYGAGNPPDQNVLLMEKLQHCRDRDVVIINKTQCHSGAVAQGHYAVGSALDKMGIISAESRTLEDLVTDLYVNLTRYTKN